MSPKILEVIVKTNTKLTSVEEAHLSDFVNLIF